MNVRHLVWSVCLLALASAPRTATAIDHALLAYQHTTWLMLEADLRLHLCHLKEFSLHLSRHSSEDVPSMGHAASDGTSAPRPVLGKDALLEQQDHDRRAIMQTQSQLEVELCRSYHHLRG